MTSVDPEVPRSEIVRDLVSVFLLVVGLLGAPIYAYAAYDGRAAFLTVLIECAAVGAALGTRR